MKIINEFDWDDFYLLAESYINENNDAKLRTGINRFYYAPFCKSRDILIENNLFLNKKSEKNLKSKKGIVHFETQNIFKNHEKIKNGTKISKNLKSLRINRNKADYEKHTDQPLNEIILESRTKSKMILELLEEEFN